MNHAAAPFVLDAAALGAFGTPGARPYIERLAACVDSVPLQACERSVKLEAGGLRANRFLLGARADRFSPRYLARCRDALGLPEGFRDRIDPAHREANAVLFGFEEDRQGCLYKLYFEYWEQVRRAAAAGDLQPRLMFRGFKWDPDDPGRRAVSEYWCLPKLPAGRIIDEIEALCGDAGRVVARAAADIVGMTIRKGRETPLVYLDVREPGNPRRSFDLNLYRAGLRLADVEPVTTGLCNAFGIRPQYLRRHVEAGDRPLGHISGGTARDGKPFFTLYYDTGPGS